jgi:phospho-N-acetylmuramoyl-pentapeptide-transferase
MLYWLIEFSDRINVLNVFRYLTVRTGGAMLTALIFVFLFGPTIIDHLRLRQGKGQPIRTDGPQSHLVTNRARRHARLRPHRLLRRLPQGHAADP